MRRLMSDYLHEIDPAGDPDTVWGDEFYAACLRGIETGTVVVLTAIEAGDLVGFSVARLDPHWYRGGLRVGVIEEFYIAPAFRGVGLGRALATETITSLRTHGASSLMAMVVQGNMAALVFWQRVGFSLEGFVLFHVAH